ncbi:MAG: hypothetical protein U0Q07_06020 [Acidimicrobiales bacterium]
MSQQQQRRRRPRANKNKQNQNQGAANGGAKANAGGKGGGAPKGNGGGKGGKGRNHLEPDRSFWSNGEAEAKVQALVGKVRPADDPTALVRSLGSAPLGRHADAAALTFDVVYRKAAQLAVALAVANGVLLDQDDEPAPGGEDATVGSPV